MKDCRMYAPRKLYISPARNIVHFGDVAHWSKCTVYYFGLLYSVHPADNSIISREYFDGV